MKFGQCRAVNHLNTRYLKLGPLLLPPMRRPWQPSGVVRQRTRQSMSDRQQPPLPPSRPARHRAASERHSPRPFPSPLARSNATRSNVQSQAAKLAVARSPERQGRCRSPFTPFIELDANALRSHMMLHAMREAPGRMSLRGAGDDAVMRRSVRSRASHHTLAGAAHESTDHAFLQIL